MNPQLTVKRGVGYLISLVAVILVVTLITTGSVNPVEVFTDGPLWAKIAIGFLASITVLGLLQVLQLAALRRMIRRTTRRDPDDVRCVECGEPLLAMAGPYGLPVCCLRCRNWRHSGPACSGKGKQVKMLLDCTACPESTVDKGDLMPDISAF